jgi:hypothetical protein
MQQPEDVTRRCLNTPPHYSPEPCPADLLLRLRIIITLIILQRSISSTTTLAIRCCCCRPALPRPQLPRVYHTPQLLLQLRPVLLATQLTLQAASLCNPSFQALHVGILHTARAAARRHNIFLEVTLQANAALALANL